MISRFGAAVSAIVMAFGAMTSNMACHTAPDKKPLPAELAGSTTQIQLSGGATITLPKGATERPVKSKRLPDDIQKAYLYRLDSDKRLLMVNEFKMQGKSCAERLASENKRMLESKKDKNEDRLRFRRVNTVERPKIDGHTALYTEFLQRGFGQQEKRPFAAMASISMCRKQNHVVLMFASDKPILPKGTKALLHAIVTSYVPGKAAGSPSK